MNRLLLILFLLLLGLYLGLMSLAEADEYPEPPLEWIMGWDVEEIPGYVSVYYDMNQDGEPDFVTAHISIGADIVDECPPPTRVGDSILLGHDCNGDPMVYAVEREIRAIRWANQRWLWAIGRTWE